MDSTIFYEFYKYLIFYDLGENFVCSRAFFEVFLIKRIAQKLITRTSIHNKAISIKKFSRIATEVQIFC